MDSINVLLFFICLGYLFFTLFYGLTIVCLYILCVKVLIFSQRYCTYVLLNDRTK